MPALASAATPSFAAGVALVDRGDVAAAVEALEMFAAANPGDARAEDAAFLALVARQRAVAGAGDESLVRAARRFLERYPESPRRGAVQAVLEGR